MAREHGKTKKTTVSYRTEVQGNVVRKVYTEQPYQQEQKARSSVNHHKKHDAERSTLSIPYCVFLAAACVVTLLVSAYYLQQQALSTSNQKTIASLESELADIKKENADELNRIESSIDLEKIREIAINELHMVYATEDNVILYKNTSHNYVSQYEDIPQEEESLLKSVLESE